MPVLAFFRTNGFAGGPYVQLEVEPGPILFVPHAQVDVPAAYLATVLDRGGYDVVCRESALGLATLLLAVDATVLYLALPHLTRTEGGDIAGVDGDTAAAGKTIHGTANDPFGCQR